MKIALGTLKDKGEDLAAFLEPRVGVKPSVAGNSIEIEDGGVRKGVKPRHVKAYVKRFLFMNGVRKNYRVFVSGRELTLQEIELGEEGKGEEKEKAKEERPEEPAGKEEEKEEEKEKEEPEKQKPKAKKAPAKKPKAKKKEEPAD